MDGSLFEHIDSIKSVIVSIG